MPRMDSFRSRTKNSRMVEAQYRICIFCFLSAPNFSKTKRGANGKFLPKPLLFHLRHPNSKTDEPKFWQILSPKNCFAKTSSALKPRHTARILGGQNPKKKNVLSIIEKIHPRENQKSKEHFFFLGLPSEARRWRGFRRAYGLISSHHALRACHIICFENKCELGTIQTPIRNSTIFSVDTSGRRKAPTKDFLAGLQGNSEFLARKRAGFFRRGGCAKSEAILTHSICLIQKEFLSL